MSSVPGVSQPSSQHTDPFSGKSDFAASGPVPADLKEATDLAMGALRAMNEARAQMGIANQGLLPKKCIYLVSKTKSGKTTLANILAGKAVTAQKRAGTWSLIAPDPMPGFTISSRKGSETTIPRVCQCKNPDEMADAVALVDLPGLDDTRGVIQEIANAVCMQKVFEECPQGKILVLVDENYVTNPRGGGLVNCMTMITDLFPGGVERIAKSVSLVVTRVKPGFTVTHMQKNIDNVIRDCLLSPAAAQLLGILKNRMALFKLPTVEGPYDTTQTVADIFASLDTAAFAQDLRVNTHLSADGQLAATSICTTIAQQTNAWVHGFLERLVESVRGCANQCFAESKRPFAVRRQAQQEKLTAIIKQLEAIEKVEEGPELLSTTIPRCTAVMAMCSQEPAPTGIEETFRQHELLTELSQFIDQNLRVRVDVGGPIKGQAALARREVHIVQEQIAALIASEEAEMARIKANQAESEAEKQEALNQQRRQEIKEAALDAAVKVVKGTVKVVAVTAIVAFKVAAFLATPLGKALKEAVQEAKRQAREKR